VISGLGCYPLPSPDHDEPFNQLRYGLSQRGFVTMWVEKNGEGSSRGPACDSAQSDLQFAANRSIAGLKALATHDFVDRDNIFIFAHSIGPLEGVLVAGKFPVRDLSLQKPSARAGTNINWKTHAANCCCWAALMTQLKKLLAQWRAANIIFL
jgi:hypothetical protein